MLSIDLLAFLVSSITSLGLIYLKVPTTVIQQAVAFLLVILLIFSNRFIFVKSLNSQENLSNKLFRFLLLSFSSLFVQLLVISSGGFYSPFLILFHLYTLGASFLLKIGSAIIFLVFSLVVLTGSTFLNKTLLTLFQQDPGSAVIYLVSFMVIIPLAQYLMSTYHIKDTLSKLLTKRIEIGEEREQSILSGLTELVLVTDINLKVLSFNEAFERTLGFSEVILGKNLFEILRLRDGNGGKATMKSLSIDKVLNNKAIHVVEGFYLETKAGNLKVAVQIRPVLAAEGVVNQIAFVITDVRATGLETHSQLKTAKSKQHASLEDIRDKLIKANLNNLALKTLLVEKTEDDLLIAQEMQDHPFKKIVSYVDLVELSNGILQNKKLLARFVGVRLESKLPAASAQEAAYLSLKSSNLPLSDLPPSEFSAPTDPRWFSIMLEKLIDLSIFLSSFQQNAYVSISLSKKDLLIGVILSAFPVNLNISEVDLLFKEYYGNLASRTNLSLGSGIEGFISKTISAELNLPIKAKISGSQLSFEIEITKEVKA